MNVNTSFKNEFGMLLKIASFLGAFQHFVFWHYTPLPSDNCHIGQVFPTWGTFAYPKGYI